MNQSTTAMRYSLPAILLTISICAAANGAGDSWRREQPVSTEQLAPVPPTQIGPAPSLTVFLTESGGGAFRLIYAGGFGWRRVAGWGSNDPVARSVALQGSATPDAPVGDARLNGAAMPLTVFIDGPTGFAFAWSLDEGWRFIGRVADRHP